MPINLDPRVGTDASSAYLDELMFDSLVSYDAHMNIVPDLAERWETPDPVTYIFHLRSGVRFHDGRPLTAADVKFTFDSILSGAVQTAKRGSYRMVTSIDTPDEHTVIFHLSGPYASFLWNLTRAGIGIVPRGSGDEISRHPIGTGPFQFVRMSADDEVILARYPGYFAGAAKIERLRFRIVPDAIVRALELRKGTADLADPNSLTPDMVAALAKEPGLAVEDEAGTELQYVAFNLDDPMLAHRKVRQALAYATDRGSMIRYLLHGRARPAASLLPPAHWAYDPQLPQYDYDPARAEKLLDAAGFPRGPDGVRFHLELKTSTEESARILSEVIAAQWRRVGVDLQPRPLETGTFYSDITRGSFQLYTFRWVGGNNDPDIFQYVFSSKRFPPNGANRGHYKNSQMDALLEEQARETDLTKRKALLWKIQSLAAEDEPYINLWYSNSVCVHRDRLAGVSVDTAGDLDFLAQAWIEPN
ncbi:MAG TPA: ABC transporter substrate-binding protein [Candidatus Acidoferrales bacterium]|nr:ABC transporter substrate-binding protein [Candidatus Acidoferrales bacterium]